MNIPKSKLEAFIKELPDKVDIEGTERWRG